MVGIIYRHPRLYDMTLRMLHGGELAERFRLIAAEVGSGSKVLDVGCGTCKLAGYLEGSCSYVGLDMNETFVRHANARGLSVLLGDVFDGGNYPDGVDVIVLSDILHHVVPRHDELIDLCKGKAEKLIVCEPYSKHSPVDKGLRCRFDRAWQRLCSNRRFNSFFGDHDGINEYDDMRRWDAYVKDKLSGHLLGHDMRVTVVDDYVLGVWKRSR